MRIDEFVDQRDLETAIYEPAEDEYNKRHLDDTRKPVLTLATLNRLKRMRALRKLEALKREDLIAVMYAAPSDAGGGGLPGF
jgi:hypothetical protein